MILLPLAILGLVGSAGIAQARRANKKAAADPATMAARQVVYETALNEVKDPAKLRTMAKAFRGEGMEAEATMLEKRAALQELPPEIKAARREALRKAMASTDAVKVLEMADAFHQQGCTGAAENLRKYAAGLTAAEEKTDEQA